MMYKFVTEFSNVVVEMTVPDEYCSDLEIVIHESKARIFVQTISNMSGLVLKCPELSSVETSRMRKCYKHC